MRIHFRGEEVQQLSWSSGHGKGQAGRRNLGQVRQQDSSSSMWAGGRQGGVHRSASALGPMHLNTSSAQAPPVVSSCLRLCDRAGEPGYSPPPCPSSEQTIRSQLCKHTGWLTGCSYAQAATRWEPTSHIEVSMQIEAHLMLYCELFDTCKSLSRGPVSWCYPHSSKNSLGIICQKTGLSHRSHRRVCLYYSHNWSDCNTL